MKIDCNYVQENVKETVSRTITRKNKNATPRLPSTEHSRRKKIYAEASTEMNNSNNNNNNNDKTDPICKLSNRSHWAHDVEMILY